MATGQIFVISGPSGVGKSTLRQKLVDELKLIYSISATTRAPREGEVDGIDYHFVSTSQFESDIAAGEYIEWANVFGNYYGTPQKPLLKNIEAGKHVVIEIDVQGAQQIRERNKDLNLPITYVFIAPPSLEDLKTRLLERDANSDQDMEKRLAEAEQEIAQSKHYNCVVVNDDLDEAFAEILDFMNRVIMGCA